MSTTNYEYELNLPRDLDAESVFQAVQQADLPDHTKGCIMQYRVWVVLGESLTDEARMVSFNELEAYAASLGVKLFVDDALRAALDEAAKKYPPPSSI